MHEIETQHVHANGLRFALRSVGKGPLVLCLHGFPDSAHTWDALLPELAKAGYRAVAPFTRGYGPTQIPEDGDYSVPTLALDVLALADALGENEFTIIGHDWGAVMAYAAAAYAPKRVRALVTAAVPPLRRFLLGMNLAQIKRSWYIPFFQLPYLPETRLRRDDCALVEQLWQSWSPDWNYTAGEIAPVKAILGRPENCKAAIGYYRALPGALIGNQRRRILAALKVPGLVIRGENDGCIDAAVFAGTEDCFTESCELHTMVSGHFMHREQPRVFSDKVLEFLAAQAA